MYSARKIVWNLAKTELMTKSKIAEVCGLTINEVHTFLKEGPEEKETATVHSYEECVFQYCPHAELCLKHGCQNNRG